MSQSEQRYLILTPLESAATLWAKIQFSGVHGAEVVPTEDGAVVVWSAPKPEFDDWDISELLGEAPTASIDGPHADAAALAADLSKLSDYGVVLLSAEIGTDVGSEPGTSGFVQARYYVAGDVGDEVPAGSLLAVVDPVVEGLIIGTLDAHELGRETSAAGAQLLEDLKRRFERE